MYNLTGSQKDLLRWLVEQVRNSNLSEEFEVHLSDDKTKSVLSFQPKSQLKLPTYLTLSSLEMFDEARLLKHKLKHTSISYEGSAKHVTCALTGNAYKAVDTNFGDPDTSFIKYLTPLTDMTNLDKELKERCLPILSAGNDSKHWDNAVLQAFRILEERLIPIFLLSDA